MLTLIEKIIFTVAAIASIYYTYQGGKRIADQITSGQGKIDWSLLPKRIVDLVSKFIFFQPVFKHINKP